MNFIIIKSNLKEIISIVERAVNENANLPILKNILIKAENDVISFTATNLEVGLMGYVSGKVIKSGSLTVPVGLLSNLISNIKTDRINFEAKGIVLEVKTDNYSATIQGLTSEDFPSLPTVKNTTSLIEIKGVFLREAIEQVGIAAQGSDIRPELNTIFFDFSLESLKLAATDGFRLAEKTIPGNNFTAKNQEPFKVLVPLKTCYEIMRIVKDDDLVSIFSDENQILFKTSRIEFISRLIEGNFPQYSQLIPEKFNVEIVVDTSEFLNGIKLAAVFGQKNGEVELKIHPNKKAIEIGARDQALGENAYVLPAKVKGETAEIVFNWRYLSDPLKIIKTNEVLLGFQEEANPAIIRPAADGSYFYIVRPIVKT
jgi:DNA polymerase III subunit beta